MSKLFVLTNHTTTESQRNDAFESLGVHELVDLPIELKNKWGLVPPETDSLEEYLNPFLEWLERETTSNDIIWVQGEWGATIMVIDWCRLHNVRCVYATTRREATELLTEKGVCMTHVFKHVRFRDFPSTTKKRNEKTPFL